MTETETSADLEFRVLTTESGRELLGRIARVVAPGPADFSRWREIAPAEWVNAAIRIHECRRRARFKYSRAEEMWLDPVGIEQATAEIVARHKAKRFEGELVVDLCSGIGGDALALAERRDIIAVDRNPWMSRRLHWNSKIYGVENRVLPLTGDVVRFSIPSNSWVHVDPDRRATSKGRSRRARRIDDYQPGPDYLKWLCRTAPGIAIKLSPASDFESHFVGPDFEVELISLDGECKEATVWAGETRSCLRRATRLPDGATWTDRDGDTSASPLILPEGSWRWIFDPDPTLIRSGLLDSFGSTHGLGRVARGIDYLVGSAFVASPFLDAFEILEVAPLDRKRLRRELNRRGIGLLEIKVRGVEISPETLRAELKLDGDRSGTLLIAGKGPTRAILAQRVGPS
jgi:hypothetical protein